MRAGLERHGVQVVAGGYNTPTAREVDFAVVWGAPSKQPAVAAACPRILVMERGHLPDRMHYASCGWDGLGRRGRYPKVDDWGARWREHWGGLMQPWRTGGEYALLLGQVPGDAALAGLDIEAWVQRMTGDLESAGWPVRFRPHPLVASRRATLAEDLAGAAICVTYNSTAGVEAVLAGVPTITLDEGAMAWEVTSHTVQDAPWRPDRWAWAHGLAWTSYTLEEIAAGLAWERLAPLLEGVPCPSA